MLYETFIELSQKFKGLSQGITEQLRLAKVHDWEDKDQRKSFFDFVSKLVNDENSVLQIVLKFNLMMSAHKPQVTWLDEISEALKNCADGLDSYAVMFNNLPYQKQVNNETTDTYLKLT